MTTMSKPRGHRPVEFGVDRCFKHNRIAKGSTCMTDKSSGNYDRIVAWLPMCDICLGEYPWYEHERRKWEQESVESQYVLCPGCAHEQALLEDAAHELENFLTEGQT